MPKKTPNQQKAPKSDDPTLLESATPDVAVASSSPEPQAAQAPPPLTPPTPPPLTPPTPPTPLTAPTPPNPVAPSIKPQVVIVKKAGERSPERRSETSPERRSENSSERSAERGAERSPDRGPHRGFPRRSFPAPTKAPAQLTECGKYKAGDQVALPYSGQTVAFTYFYQGVKPEEWWGAFEGGCIRLSAIL